MRLRFLMSPDSDGSGGNSEPKTFTQEQLEQIVQGRLSKLQEQLASVKADSSKKDKDLEELKKKVEELSSRPPTPPSSQDDSVDGRIKLLEQRYKSEVTSLKESVDQEKQLRVKETERRRAVERDRELSEALQLAGCRPDALEVAARYMLASIVFDDGDEKWVYNIRAGGVVSIRDGVAAELPDYLKDSSIKSGGSGSKSGNKASIKEAKLKTEREKLETLSKVALASGSEQDIAAYQIQKRVVQQLEGAA